MSQVDETTTDSFRLLAQTQTQSGSHYLQHYGFESFVVSQWSVREHPENGEQLFDSPVTAIAHWELTHGQDN